MLACCICSVNIFNQNRQALSPTNNKTLVVRVNPDDVSVDNNYVHGQGVLMANHQKILVKGAVKSKVQLNNIKSSRSVSLWKFNGDVDKIDSPTNVNQFNAKKYYQSIGIMNSIKVNRFLAVQPLYRFNIIDKIHVFRQILLLRAQHLPASLRIYTLSLILGDTNQENEPELSGVKQLGLIHLFSISGFHVYYLVGLLELILVHLRIKREHYRLMILIFLPTYYFFAGASIGLLRSILMVEIGLLGRSIHRYISSLNVWSLALILNLIMDPQSLIQFGCQLSYVLSFALIYTRKYSFWKQTVFMNLVSFPFIIYNVYNWHVLTIAANLLILPLFSAIVFPIVIMGSILSYFSSMIGNFASIVIGTFDYGLNWISNLPGNIYFGKPNLYLMLIALLITLYIIGHPSKKWLWILFCLYLFMFVEIHFPIDGQVSYFDVGQGDSFLVRSPFNQSITIIDTGGKVAFGQKEKSSTYQSLRTSINYLNSQGIHTVDNICISHQDADHCGDLPAFLQNLCVKRIFIPYGMNRNQRFMNRIRPYLRGTQLIPVKNGDQIPGTNLTVVHPFVPGLGANSDSMVLLGRYGGKRWLFMGDLGQQGEKDIIEHYSNLSATVLKLGHHGSSTSSCGAFLDRIRPKIAVISAGRNNRYHHPNLDVVNRVKVRHIKIYNTQNDGMITYYYHQARGYWSTNN